eukprot:TRINITY_DN11194_c0_g1_i2.p1 TRINITY_DN11194_c0_g1~~TRINITY_DN11194_c0_g1_i2.p1  ORF type:complete len:241 (-),score=51.45 TRINITY_DN11194_c0_g1_i2:568-1290(-)
MSAAAGTLVAAIDGAVGKSPRNRKNFMQCNLAQEVRERKKKEQEEQERLDRFAEKMLRVYDKNSSGDLRGDEVGEMLRDVSKNLYHVSGQQVTGEDVQFLLAVCSRSREALVTRDEVLDVCYAWGDFLEHRKIIEKLVARHDADLNGKIDICELGGLLQEVAEGKSIPKAVVDWIFTTADVSANGYLTTMEVARALCALKIWKSKQDPGAECSPAAGLGGEIEVPDELAKKSSSCVCTVS